MEPTLTSASHALPVLTTLVGLLRMYTEKWPKIGAGAGMALGGGSILAANRKTPLDPRTLAVMNSMTMAAH